MAGTGNVRRIGEQVRPSRRGLETFIGYIVKGLPEQPRRYEARLEPDGSSLKMAVAGAFEAPSVSAVGPAATLSFWGEAKLGEDHASEIIERLAAVMVAFEAGKVVPVPGEVTTNVYNDGHSWVDEQVAIVGLTGDDDIMTCLQCNLGNEEFGDLQGARIMVTGNGGLPPLDDKGRSEAVMRTFAAAEAVTRLVLEPLPQA